MNNAIFGKTMENVRNHVKLLTKWEGRYGAEAMIAKPNFHSRSVFSKNLVAIEMRKLEVRFDKSIYVSMCILDISFKAKLLIQCWNGDNLKSKNKDALHQSTRIHFSYVASLWNGRLQICKVSNGFVYWVNWTQGNEGWGKTFSLQRNNWLLELYCHRIETRSRTRWVNPISIVNPDEKATSKLPKIVCIFY